MKLEEITKGTLIRGIVHSGNVEVIEANWIGSDARQVIYKNPDGKPETELIYRDMESELELVKEGRPWSFDGDSRSFRLVSEARRIQLAYLFDPLLAVHTSRVDPLPHQITAVYESMLPRQPLRYLLADDPGAGKTIMTGLLLKELIVRGDLERCLIVCPGNLVEQWQDELYEKFSLPFEIMTNDNYEAARTGNWFKENPFAICRLDKLSRNEDVQEKLKATDWDIVICDEAHKMSASYFGGEIKRTKRHMLGRLLTTLTRHFLLLTATPHNGKEEDFQLFMALIDGDRFEGKFRDGVHAADVSDLMRRMVKEDLVKFDGKPLFPERKAYTLGYQLSDAEAKLYAAVTNYVREEFNRADSLLNDKRKGTVGFALTILQRRLASSPEAIYQSLRRRKERLEKRLAEEELLKRGEDVKLSWDKEPPDLSDDDIEELDDAPDEEVEEQEESIMDRATAAQTISELKAEIATLKELTVLADNVRHSGSDKKWDELSSLLQNQSDMFDAHGHRRKLIIFTEHRDTLSYLVKRITALLGRPEAVVTIHGGMGRDKRREAEQLFKQDKDVEVLVATDAAGEGINLQRAHLMVNYDLPWNPNRLEQRFGRIHRIGQKEVCHCWNLVAKETREGYVFTRLMEKLETEREALGGKVFDILGRADFDDQPLRKLLIKAIRYGDDPDVKRNLDRVVDKALDHEKILDLIEDNALARDTMDSTKIQKIREDMERAEARRLQPHFIASFFIEAFKVLGGSVKEREPKRYEITNVPAIIRNRDRLIGQRNRVQIKYERITFDKELISVSGKPLAEFVCPGHPLLNSIIDIIIELHHDLMKRGTVLIDDSDEGQDIRALMYLEHSVQDANTNRDKSRRIISRQLEFVEIDKDYNAKNAGYAPYLDYREVKEEERDIINQIECPEWLTKDIEQKVLEYAAIHIAHGHLKEIKARKEALIDKTLSEVKKRLTAEITYWDHRAQQLQEQEQAGKVGAKLNSANARMRADELSARLQKRTQELELERKISALPPNVIGGTMVIPIGLIRKMQGKSVPDTYSRNTVEVERIAMERVMEIERNLGYQPRDVSMDNCGYDIESRIPDEPGRLRFIEVKGRASGADTVTVTKNEILTGLNKPDGYILALIEVDGDTTTDHYIPMPFENEPDFGVTSVNYKLKELKGKAIPV
jgi:SNF2 family DNA or RNA helicase